MRNALPFGSCRCLFLLVVAVLFLDSGANAGEPQPPKGFTSLFNGKDLTGWHGMPDHDPYKLAAMPEADRKALIGAWTEDARKHWKVEKGELVSDGDGPYLTTDEKFADIELLYEYKTMPKARSGNYLRATPAFKNGVFSREEKPSSEWNRCRILMVGEHVTVYLNDKLVVDHYSLPNLWNKKLPLPKTEVIQLMARSGESRWRNLFVREIPATEGNAFLSRYKADGFRSVFNGKDFDGWAGPLDNYEVRDGAIVCRPKKGGNIHTKEVFTDFVSRLEYKLPAAGNNGLAIRYPGKGRASVDAMCEIQILDDDAPQYKKLDPRQYNGSAYGMVAAHRGYLRPTGEWNFIETTVRGSTIRVELNGTLILDTDLARVTETKGGEKHPGKDRTSGHFGFCGHNDPVEFRNIQIKPLDPK